MKLSKYYYSVDVDKHGSKYHSMDVWKKHKEELMKFYSDEPTILIYIGGATEHHSSSRACVVKGVEIKKEESSNPIKAQIGYIAANLAKRLGNIVFLDVDSNTCASSMSAMMKAEMYMNAGIASRVVVYGDEVTDPVQKWIFKVNNTGVTLGGGVCVMELRNGGEGYNIGNVTMKRYDDGSPFTVSEEGYRSVLGQYLGKKYDVVKVHGSGTAQNNEAEGKAIADIDADKVVEYKSEIGHTQGISTMIEMCMMIDREEFDTALVVASGLGNYYGCCEVTTD